MRHPLPECHGLGGRGRKRGFFVVGWVWRRVEEEHKGREGLEGNIVECETGLADLEHSMWLWRFPENRAVCCGFGWIEALACILFVSGEAGQD